MCMFYMSSACARMRMCPKASCAAVADDMSLTCLLMCSFACLLAYLIAYLITYLSVAADMSHAHTLFLGVAADMSHAHTLFDT